MGQGRYFKGGQNSPALGRLGKLGKIKLRRLFQIGQGLLECLALCGGARLRVMCHQPIAIRVGIYNGRKIQSFLLSLHRFTNIQGGAGSVNASLPGTRIAVNSLDLIGKKRRNHGEDMKASADSEIESQRTQ
jgi:hypothetical protein